MKLALANAALPGILAPTAAVSAPIVPSSSSARAAAIAAPLALQTALLAQLGDRLACRALVEAHQRPVLALIARLCAGRRSGDVVEDLAQETFLRVFRALQRFSWDGTATLSTWILTVATRVALDELRRPWPKRLVALFAGASRPDAAPSPEQLASMNETRRHAERALATLSTDQRAALVLRVFHGLTYAEIAAALGVDENTVKTRVHRARVSLRAALGGIDDHA